MPLVRKLWTEEEGLMTIRAWVSPMDPIETNDDLSHEEAMKKMKNFPKIMNPWSWACLMV